MCSADYKIGVIGSVSIAASFISTFALMHLSDFIGWWGAAIIYYTLNLFAISMLMYVRKYETLVFIIFIYGLTILVKATTAYTYALELVVDS